MRLLELLSDVVRPIPIEESRQFKDAHAFKENIEPVDGVDYEWVWDYAKDFYDRVSKVYKDLDDKANDIIKYLGGGAGLFTLGALVSVNAGNVWTVVFAIPAFLSAVVSVFFASLARKPNETRLPPDVKAAFNFATYYEDDKKKARANFLGQWHEACEGMERAVAIKGERVRFATWAFFGSIALLALPVVVAVLLKLFAGAPPTMPYAL